jgi:outer membrane protein assembly factor BamD
MRIRTILPLFVVGACLTLMTSCGGFESVKKSSDVNYKLTMANKYYDQKQYLKSSELYQDLIPVMKGTKNFEPMYYRFAMSFYNLKNYYSAAYHFKVFTTSFPTSKETEEAAFLHAYCLYKLSPKITVEQTNTEKSIEVLEAFVNKYPESKHLEEANKYINEGTSKLEQKDVSAAELYFRISQYKAAGVAYKSVMAEYPDSHRLDEYQFMIVKSHYYYAKSSVATKQEERYVSVLNAYQELVDSYPKSKYLQEAEKFFTLASNNIKHIRNEHK